ncbi:MAG: gliding motility-associated protein GldE [Saprospiraceae bacterium]
MDSIPGTFFSSLLNSSFLLADFPFWEVSGAAIFVIILLLCSALISGSEVAFFSLSPNDIDELKQENSKTSERIIKLKEMPRTLLATILISNNFINIGIVVLSDFVLGKIMPSEIFTNWAIQIGAANYLSFIPLIDLTNGDIALIVENLIKVVGVVFLLVLFGEVAPKVYANLNNVKLAKMMSGSLSGLNKFFSPASKVLVNWTNYIEGKLESKAQKASLMSKEDIDEAIELTVRNDDNAEEEVDILKSILKFGDVTVKQIMRSRVDVIAIEFRTGFREVLKLARRAGVSRIPIFDDDFDNITGILYTKDLVGYTDEGDDFEWQALIRTDLLYVPESKKISDLLKEFQQQKLHMAMVVDEYGGSSGIVTLEDVLEEVIGEIKDEFDDLSEIDFTKKNEYTYVFEGKTLLNDMCRVMDLETTTFDEAKGDADTIAGLMLELFGQIPKINAESSYNQYRFKIVSVNKRRVKQVQIILPKKT